MAESGAPPAVSPPRELRFAVSMNGGVSLAVWMGGVTAELLELIRSTDPLDEDTSGPSDESRCGYRDLMYVLGQSVRVDVIAGASAGGINGALLGMAIAHNLPEIDRVRSVWLDDGDLAGLVRSPGKRKVSSLLDGAKFRRSLHQAFLKLFESASTSQRGPGSDVSVEMTVTVLDGIMSDVATAARASASFPVAFEPVCLDVSKDSFFRRQLRPVPPEGSKKLWVVDGGTLNNKPIDRVLNKIFEQKASGPVRRVVLHVVPDPGSELTSPPTGEKVRGKSPMPSLPSVLWKSLVAMPRNQSVRAEIERIEDNNRRAGGFAMFRWKIAAELARAAGDRVDESREDRERRRDELVSIASPFCETFKLAASHQSAIKTWRNTRHAIAASGSGADLAAIDEGRVVDALARHRANHYPHVYFPVTSLATHGEPVDGDGAQFWGYGLTSAQRIAAAVIDLIQGVAGSMNPVAQTEDAIATLFAIQAKVHDQLAVILNVRTDPAHLRDRMESFGKLRKAPSRSGDIAESFDVDLWALEFYSQWSAVGVPGTSTEDGAASKQAAYLAVGRAAVECGELLRSAAEPVRFLVSEWVEGRWLDEQRRKPFVELAAAVESLTWWDPPADDRTGFSGADWTVRQLLAIEMLYSASASETMVPQTVELAQLSAYARDHVAALAGAGTERATPAEKLTGVRAGHFAAFYRRSWRANDWMWGRIDAADLLTVTALDRKSLVQRWTSRSAADLHAALRRAAISTPAGLERLSEDLESCWDRDFGRDLLAQKKPGETVGDRKLTPLGLELSRVTNGDDGGGADVGGMDLLAKVRDRIALRRQVEIAVAELPLVAEELRRDLEEAGTGAAGSQSRFLEVVEKLENGDGGPSLNDVAAALGECRIGEETLGDYATSDGFAQVTGHGVATLSNVVQTAIPWKGLRRATAGVRGVGLSVHALATLRLGGGSVARTWLRSDCLHCLQRRAPRTPQRSSSVMAVHPWR